MSGKPEITYSLSERLRAAKHDEDLTIDQIVSKLPQHPRASIGFLFAGTQGTRPAPYTGLRSGDGKNPILEDVCKVLKLDYEEIVDLALQDSANWRAYVEWQGRQERRKRKRRRTSNECYTQQASDKAILVAAGT